MDPDSMVSLILPPVILIILQFLFILGVNAITELPDSQLKRDAEEDKTFKKILDLTQRPSRFMLGSEVFEMLATLLFAFSILRIPALSEFNRRFLLEYGNAALLAVLVLFAGLTILFILPICRLLPRRIALRSSKLIARGLYPYISFCLIIVSPVTALASLIGSALMLLVGIDPGQQPDQVTEEEIRMMVDAGEETGVIQQSEKDMINNIFEFDDRTAAEVMTHRTDLVAVDINAQLEEILSAAAQGYSRIPVYRDDIDNIVGILYVKDLLQLITSGSGGFSAEKLMRKALFVPESTRCRELFSTFTTQKLQLAVVIDEYGGTSGIVTMEDLLESIVGNMQDEYDQEEDQSSQISEKKFTLDGSMGLDEVEHLLDIILPEDTDYETIGGLIVGILDRIPDEDEHPTVEISGVKFTAVESDERRIIKIVAEKE